MIEIKNIEKKFGDNHVLKNVSFTFEQGKTNLIIGESGSGKTTLIKILVGLHQKDQGLCSTRIYSCRQRPDGFFSSCH